MLQPNIWGRTFFDPVSTTEASVPFEVAYISKTVSLTRLRFMSFDLSGSFA